ncbi:DeoR/GlpR family DNA-binding transcription regulator [Labrys neptuniae]
MHEQERWQAIVRLVGERSVISARELAAVTRASPATIRRDLTHLAAQGMVQRMHGGVRALASPEGAKLEARRSRGSQALNAERKRAIAERAAALCRDGESIIINGGSTTFHMVEFLRASRLQILTNSFPIAAALMQESDNRIILPGGEIYRDQSLILSPFDEDSIQHYTASKMFMSAASIGPLGLIESDPLIARAEAKLLNRAADLVVLVDSSKFEPRGSMAVAPLSRIRRLITDDGIPLAARDMLKENGVEVEVVRVAG